MPKEGLSAAQRSKIRRLAAPGEANVEEGKEINVVPFLDIITNVLMFVLATLAVTFTASIDVDLGRPTSIRAAQQATLGLAVIVVGDGFSVKARGGNVATGCETTGSGLAIPKREGRYDYTALRDCAAKLKASSPEFSTEEQVTVTANPDVPYDTVIATFDALRTSRGGDKLFPEVAFGVVR
ncbi:MAG: biopolymer transporter ExbD [Labilithrix sp.]